MPSGLYLLAPIFVFNLAGEMMYILNQRLKAQSVPPDKASKVLADIGGAIYKNEFVVELMKSQKPLTITFLKDLFNQLVHTSIMRLNENSMSKLFDLMVMSFKMQVLLTSAPAELYHITLNHFKELIKMIQKGSTIANLENALAAFRDKYEGLPLARYVEIKQESLRILESYRIRISVLLTEGLQNEDGTLIYHLRYTPYAAKPIGTIEYLQKGLTTTDKLGPYDKELQFFPGKQFKDWTTDLGLSVFDGNIPVKGRSKAEKRENVVSSSTIKFPSASQISSKAPTSTHSIKEDNSLSNLLLGDRKPIDESELFTLDMFSDPTITKNAGNLDQPQKQSEAVKQKPKINNTFKDKILSEFEEPEKQQEQQQEEDLLDMLDNATK